MKTPDLYDEWKKTGRIKRKDLITVLIELYIIHSGKSGHPGTSAAPVPPGPLITFPIELFEMIASYATRKKDPFADHNMAQVEKAELHRQRVQARADEIRDGGRIKSARAAARIIAKEQGGNEDTIRRMISKKKLS